MRTMEADTDTLIRDMETSTAEAGGFIQPMDRS